MDRYARRNIEDLVVPNYQETSDSYPSPDIFGGWNMNSSEAAAEKCFDYDVINNGFSGGLYSQMSSEEEEEESKRLKTSGGGGGGCFYNNNNSASSLHDFDGIQQMDDMFLNSILEDVPGNELDNNNSTGSSSAYLDGREVPMFNYNWETCHDMPFMEEEAAPMKVSGLSQVKMEEPSAEEVVLQDLQRASEMLTDDSRKCFRDTFYRLAKNSQQDSESGNTYSEEDTTSRNRNQKTESETNSIDRAIANLTFNKMESNMRNMPAPKRLSSIQG